MTVNKEHANHLARILYHVYKLQDEGIVDNEDKNAVYNFLKALTDEDTITMALRMASYDYSADEKEAVDIKAEEVKPNPQPDLDVHLL